MLELDQTQKSVTKKTEIAKEDWNQFRVVSSNIEFFIFHNSFCSIMWRFGHGDLVRAEKGTVIGYGSTSSH